MAAAVQSGKSDSGTPGSKDSCLKRGGCSDPEAPAASSKQDSLMPEIQESEDSSCSSVKRQADQLADDIRHTLSTSKQHILQTRPSPSDGGGSVDSDPPDTPPRPRRQRISSRVHFPEDVHDPEIHVSRERDGGVDVNLGFLQVNHRYKCCFTVINSVGGAVHIPEVKSAMIHSVTSYVNQDEDGHDVELRIISHKDGVLSADFDMISDSDETKKCKVVIHARFLGKDQGTPLLKEGVRCLGSEVEEEESEGSDWAGYE
ncbi:adipose-secreted signaling protein-like [Amphiura filiformis]|uniref:adipose-secreted signaling protein-like n=1 Tax=Amphiura filiformis TaxID=82378 RepID=UPI003B216987